MTLSLMATPVLADQRMQMVVVQSDPAATASCEVIVFATDHVILSKDIERGGTLLKKSGSINLDAQGLKLFEAAVAAMADGTFPLAAAEDEVLEAPYVHLVYREGEAGEVSLERRSVLPGTDIPPVMHALFEPLDPACLGG